MGTIVLSHVLEHLPKPVETLRALSEHAEAIAVAVPNSLSARALLQWSGIPGRFAYAPGEHVWQMTPAALRGIFNQAGLRLMYLRAHANAPARAGFRSAIMRRLRFNGPTTNGGSPAMSVGADGHHVSDQVPTAVPSGAPSKAQSLAPRVAARAADRTLFEIERRLHPPWVGEQVVAIGRTRKVAAVCVSKHVRPSRLPDASSRPRLKRKLVVLTTTSSAVWDYTILALERNLAETGVAQLNARRLGANSLGARAAAKLGLLRNYGRLETLVFFKALMTPSAPSLFPTEFLFETVLYCMDCFPPAYPQWEKLLRALRPKVLFISSRQSAAHFHDRLGATESVWMPEATDPTEYRPERSLAKRRIDVLEIGRRHDSFHEKITDKLSAAGKVHFFELTPGQVVFPLKSDFVSGLGDSKISICFPCSMTHPARSGDCETTTHRYFESIASRSLIVGRCPRELHDLFGYDPVIAVDWSDPSGQILEILGHIAEYQEQVERNYRRLLEVGTWKVRTRAMLDFLRQRAIGISWPWAGANR
jgi:hypothetical protein